MKFTGRRRTSFRQKLDEMAMAVREQVKVLKDKTYLLRDVGVLRDISNHLDGILSRLPSTIHQHQEPQKKQLSVIKRKNVSLKLRKNKKAKFSKYLL